MIIIRGHNRLCQERSFITLLDSSLSPVLDDQLFNQPTGPPRANHPITIVYATVSPVLKYIKEDL